MGENTKISWATHTFNAWAGCQRVSPACENCYAERWAKRSGLVVWGPNQVRRRTSAANWREPLKWNRRAAAAGVRERVFVNSLSDWAEARDDLDPIRADLFALIRQCPALDFLLLTKRADNIQHCLPADFDAETYPNVWLGFTAENQEWFEKRAKAILAQPGLYHRPAVWFVSAEPLLGPIDFKLALCWIDQVIVGGESGPGHRPLDLDAARFIRDQCRAVDVAFWFKQVGGMRPESGGHELDGEVIQQLPQVA